MISSIFPLTVSQSPQAIRQDLRQHICSAHATLITIATTKQSSWMADALESIKLLSYHRAYCLHWPWMGFVFVLRTLVVLVCLMQLPPVSPRFIASAGIFRDELHRNFERSEHGVYAFCFVGREFRSIKNWKMGIFSAALNFNLTECVYFASTMNDDNK